MRLWRSLLTAAVTGFLCLVAPSFATVTTVPIYPQTVQTEGASFTASPLTYKIIYTGGANGSKVTGIICSSTDTAVAHLMTVFVNTVSASVLCSTTATDCTSSAAVTVPINAGIANTVPAINFMSPTNWPGLPVDSDGNPYIYLTSAQSIQATYATALTSSTQVSCVAIGADF